MDLKTYRSNSMAGALAEVKKDLGPDAVILRTRNYKAGGVMGLGGNTVVEITAARESAGVHAAPRPARRRPIPAAEPAPSVETAESPRERAGFEPLLPDRRPVAPKAAEPAEREPKALVPEPSRVEPTPVRFKPADGRAYAALESELASIRQLVGDVLRTTRKTHIRVEGAGAFAPTASAPSDPLYSLYGTLSDHGVPGELADEIVGRVREDLDAGEAREPAVIRESAVRTIASMIRVAEPAVATEGSSVEALIGPTGVGKTTTIAKLAASYKLRHGKSVGLITADTYRIAAVDQLRTYAGIIGIPLEVVLDPSDIPDAIERQRAHDVVLIDTPGRSPRDAARLDQLAAVLDAVGPCRRHLVLSAGASDPVLRAASQQFGRLDPDALIVTKADEAGALGVLLGILRLTDLPLSYLTTGQEVPDDLEAARPERLARAVLDGGLPG